MDTDFDVLLIDVPDQPADSPGRANGKVARQSRDEAFEQRVRDYAEAVRRLVAYDPGHRKELDRIDETLRSLLEIEIRTPELGRRQAIDQVIRVPAADLDVYRTSEIVTDLKAILVDAVGDEAVYQMVENERHWTKKTTSWLTWEQLFGTTPPPGRDEFLAGKTPKTEDVHATRRRLGVLLAARLEDIQVHRERSARRKRNLEDLATVLIALLVAIGGVAIVAELMPAPILVLSMLMGMLGSTLSGTIKARDTLTRATDIEAFRDAMPAQLLVGGTAALALVVLLRAGLVTIAGLDLGTWQALPAAGFLAGFSEPYFLGSIRRVTTLGQGATGSDASAEA